MKKRVYIGADHRGFKLKNQLLEHLEKKYDVIDLGNIIYDKNDDYPIYATRVGLAVSEGKSFGILICGSGQGISIAANKVKGIRAALCENVKDAKLSRSDDDANIICLQGTTKLETAKKMIKTFIETKLKTKNKYKRRINQIKRLEK